MSWWWWYRRHRQGVIGLDLLYSSSYRETQLSGEHVASTTQLSVDSVSGIRPGDTVVLWRYISSSNNDLEFHRVESVDGDNNRITIASPGLARVWPNDAYVINMAMAGDTIDHTRDTLIELPNSSYTELHFQFVLNQINDTDNNFYSAQAFGHAILYPHENVVSRFIYQSGWSFEVEEYEESFALLGPVQPGSSNAVLTNLIYSIDANQVQFNNPALTGRGTTPTNTRQEAVSELLIRGR